MITKVKETRVKIDALAQLTKDLKPFKAHKAEIKDNYAGRNGTTPLVQVEDDFSNPPEMQGYRHHLIIKTDRGTFRAASGLDINEKDFGIDQNSKHINSAVDALYMAKAWLGKTLACLGSENPYGSGYKTVGDIVPTACVAEKKEGVVGNKDAFDFGGYTFILENYNELSHVAKVDTIRAKIDGLLRVVNITEECNMGIYNSVPVKQHGPFMGAWLFAYQYLCEARFHLGFELGRIKAERDKLVGGEIKASV